MKKTILALTTGLLTTMAFSETANFQLSLVPDVAIEERDTTINGFSFGLYNENAGYQWQMGVINGAPGESKGFQSFIPFVFFPAIFNYADSFMGAQLGIVNWTSESITGAQLGLVSGTADLTGLQWSGVNYAKHVTAGVQIGWVNYTETVENWNFQVGLVNIIADNAWFEEFPSEFAQGMIIVNWSFQ